MASDLLISNIPTPSASEAHPREVQRSAPKPTSQAGTKKFADELARPDAPPESSRDDPKGLKSLKKIAAGKRQEIDATPALAFLTGHLERLQAGQIPELVSKNTFMTDALGEADIMSFLNEATPLHELISDLGLPQSLLKDAQALGLDPKQMISPNDLFKALGIDPQRVFAELKILKESMAAGGLASYMKRAKSLPSDEILPSLQTSADKKEAATDMAAMAAASQVPPQAAPKITPSIELEKAVAGPGTGTPKASPSLPLSNAPTDNLNTLSGASSSSLDDALALQGVKTELGGPNTPDSLGLEAALLAADSASALTPEETAAITAKLNAEAAQAPTMHRSSYDSFHSMGARLIGRDVQNINAGQHTLDSRELADMNLQGDELPQQKSGLTRNTSIEPATLKLPALSEAIAAQHLRSINPSDEQTAASFSPDDSDGSDTVTSPLAHIFERSFKGASGGQQVPSLAREQSSTMADLGSMRTIPIEELRLGSSRGQERGGFDFMSDTPARDEDGGSDLDPTQASELPFVEALGSREASSPSSTSASAKPTAEAPTTMTPEQRAQAMQQVLDRASILAREGGGTVKLDLATPELGNLELAVNMQDDRLDLRIMTGSDRVRDAMAAELNALRNALSVQNIQLGNVDVGVSGREPQGFNAFTGGEPQGRGFSGQENERSPARRSVNLSGHSIAPVRSTQPIQPNTAEIVPGRIEIRV